MSTSPCFRDNEVDDIHFSDFMKVELCVVAPKLSPAWTAKRVGDAAHQFARTEGLFVSTVNTDIGFDIVSDNGIEIGSYGWRHAEIGGAEQVWAYGTGLAEPRFSQALQQQRRKRV